MWDSGLVHVAQRAYTRLDPILHATSRLRASQMCPHRLHADAACLLNAGTTTLHGLLLSHSPQCCAASACWLLSVHPILPCLHIATQESGLSVVHRPARETAARTSEGAGGGWASVRGHAATGCMWGPLHDFDQSMKPNIDGGSSQRPVEGQEAPAGKAASHRAHLGRHKGHR